MNTQKFKIRCTKCDKPQEELFVVWDRGRDKAPSILCRKCYAKLKAREKYNKLPEYLKKRPSQTDIKKTAFREMENRRAVVTRINRPNTTVYKITFYQDDIKVGYTIRKTRVLTLDIANKWAREGIMTGDSNLSINNNKKPASKAKIRYMNKYRKGHYTSFYMQFNNVTDAELIEALRSVPSKPDFIREMYELYKHNKGC